MRRLLPIAVVVALSSSCGAPGADISGVPDLPEMSADEFEAKLAVLDRPAVVNVWASWCIPCRSEAPLLNAAFEVHRDQVGFIGVDVQDNQSDAKAFLAEFDLRFEHVFDRSRSIPNRFGGFGTPITFFFDSGGELVSTHNGIIDERGLALGIDELLHLDP
ncbi:MAG TPA: TlpA disulfide reductase family protein [Acidimicrobiia bacterium]|nr:TlpA disulfide reductase family protein [Acidimicrobiia bacterium]